MTARALDLDHGRQLVARLLVARADDDAIAWRVLGDELREPFAHYAATFVLCELVEYAADGDPDLIASARRFLLRRALEEATP